MESIAIIGTGYVGLVAGACLAEFGHRVVCCDINEAKIAALNGGEIPIFEEGLSELVAKHRGKRLFFTTNSGEAIGESNIIIIAVDTPASSTGEANLNAVRAVAKTIGENMNGGKAIFVKSTIGVGGIQLVREIVQHLSPHSFNISYAPEFLREGTAVHDFQRPERVILGTDAPEAKEIFLRMMHPLREKKIPFLFTNIATAEIIKHAANSFLAVKLSFINEIAALAERVGANIKDIVKGLGLDSRIGMQYLNPGPGYGGACLPKDTEALVHEATELGLDLKVIEAAIRVNEEQPKRIVDRLEKLLKSTLQGKKIAILGLAFKANTDDVRSSPALAVIQELIERGAAIQTYDPVAMPNTAKLYPDLTYCDTAKLALKNADGVLIMTEWDEFKSLRIKHPVVIDTRNILT